MNRTMLFAGAVVAVVMMFELAPFIRSVLRHRKIRKPKEVVKPVEAVSAPTIESAKPVETGAAEVTVTRIETKTKNEPKPMEPPPPPSDGEGAPQTPSGTGEREFLEARAMMHQMIPDYSNANDLKYLEKLGQSAKLGYSPALKKLGDYAMRRGASVEAYYWMWMARHAGEKGLDQVLNRIRFVWAEDGYQGEYENVHPMFTESEGSIGRALLDMDTGREAASAKAYLRKVAPFAGI